MENGIIPFPPINLTILFIDTYLGWIRVADGKSSKPILRSIKRRRKKGDEELLDRLVPVTGLNRSYLATAPGSYDREKEAAKPGTKGKRKARPGGKRGGRPRKYGEEFAGVPSAIRDDYGKPCGKLPVPTATPLAW
jgi:hypothetical protein